MNEDTCSTLINYYMDYIEGHVDAAELLKIEVANPHVWDVVDPHTPPRIQLGLQSPPRRHLLESSRKPSLRKVVT
jgi:hypothetical protein